MRLNAKPSSDLSFKQVNKARLAAANVSAYPQIFRLAELKGLVASLKALPTKEVVFNESLG